MSCSSPCSRAVADSVPERQHLPREKAPVEPTTSALLGVDSIEREGAVIALLERLSVMTQKQIEAFLFGDTVAPPSRKTITGRILLRLIRQRAIQRYRFDSRFIYCMREPRGKGNTVHDLLVVDSLLGFLAHARERGHGLAQMDTQLRFGRVIPDTPSPQPDDDGLRLSYTTLLLALGRLMVRTAVAWATSLVLAFYFVVAVPNSVDARSPAVLWTPGAVEETIATGETATHVVGLTANRDLYDVTFWVVPELAPFVDVNPSSVASIAAGAGIALDLSIAIPSATPIRTYEGAILVRAEGRRVARPLPMTLNVGQAVGPAGGVVTSADGRATLDISPAAISGVVTITMTPDPASPLESSGAAVSPTYDLGPDGTIFFAPTTLTITYDPTGLPPGFGESDLVILSEAEDGVWRPLTTDVDTGGNAATTSVLHLTRFAIVTPAYGAVIPHSGTMLSLFMPGLTCTDSVCVGETTFGASTSFHVEHGWGLGFCSGGSSAEQEALMADPGLRFDLYLDGAKLEPVEHFGCNGTGLLKRFLFNFPDGLALAHIFRGEWWQGGSPVLVINITVHFGGKLP